MDTSIAPRHFRALLYGALRAALTGILLLVVLAGALCWALQGFYAGRICPGVDVLGVGIGGLSRPQALARLEEALGGGGLPYVALHAAGEEWILSAAELGGRLALEEAVAEAWALGRSGVFRHDLVARLRALWYGYRVVPRVTIEPGEALRGLRRVAVQAGEPARQATLRVAGLQARAGAAETGHDLHITATRLAIEEAVAERLGEGGWYEAPRWARWRRHTGPGRPDVAEPVRVPLVFREVAPSLTEVSGAAEQATLILSTPITLTATLEEFDDQGRPRPVERRWLIDQPTLSAWLALERRAVGDEATLAVTVDRERIAAYAEAFAAALARPPREGRFTYDPATEALTALTPGQNGLIVDAAALAERVAAACLHPGDRAVEVPLRIVSPRVTRRDLEALMPLSLISVGQTSFAGSTPDRLQNIRAATARFHGLTIPAGAAFSFLEHLGPVTAANGYSEAWIILGERTVLGPGGGVCQVSTTCYRAAFYGGYPLDERWAHTYRVSWYEPPLGLDAAVYSPGTDMRFTNDTDTPILIVTEIDEANAALYFRFYGAPRDREVVLEGPIATNPVPAGPAIVSVDPSLPPGARVTIETAHDGLDVTIYRSVRRDGVEVARDEVVSRYVPWPARYAVGPAE